MYEQTIIDLLKSKFLKISWIAQVNTFTVPIGTDGDGEYVNMYTLIFTQNERGKVTKQYLGRWKSI